jgi:hypothetical protein
VPRTRSIQPWKGNAVKRVPLAVDDTNATLNFA